MPKIIVTSRYIKPNAHKKFGNYIKHIATCEGGILRKVLAMRARKSRTRNSMTMKPEDQGESEGQGMYMGRRVK